MNILTTVFLRVDKQKITYPNSVLATKPIANYYRSPDMRDNIDFSIHVSTPVEKVSLMKQRITRYESILFFSCLFFSFGAASSVFSLPNHLMGLLMNYIPNEMILPTLCNA